MNIKHFNLKNRPAYSLTEWMVVIAVVVVVIAIAIPSYKAYMSKKHMNEVNVLLHKQFDSVAERSANGMVEATTMNNPIPAISSLVTTATSNGGTVVVHFTQTSVLSRAFEKVPVIATYTAVKNNNVITWSCSSLASTGTLSHEDRVVINSKFLTNPQCSI